MSPNFQCPACRARQPLQNECRRCRADLSLVVSARRRINFLQSQLTQLKDGSPTHDQSKKELQALIGTISPNNVH